MAEGTILTSEFWSTALRYWRLTPKRRKEWEYSLRFWCENYMRTRRSRWTPRPGKVSCDLTVNYHCWLFPLRDKLGVPAIHGPKLCLHVPSSPCSMQVPVLPFQGPQGMELSPLLSLRSTFRRCRQLEAWFSLSHPSTIPHLPAYLLLFLPSPTVSYVYPQIHSHRFPDSHCYFRVIIHDQTVQNSFVDLPWSTKLKKN